MCIQRMAKPGDLCKGNGFDCNCSRDLICTCSNGIGSSAAITTNGDRVPTTAPAMTTSRNAVTVDLTTGRTISTQSQSTSMSTSTSAIDSTTSAGRTFSSNTISETSAVRSDDSFGNTANAENGGGLDTWVIGAIAAAAGAIALVLALAAVACLVRRRRSPRELHPTSRTETVVQDGKENDDAEYGGAPSPAELARVSDVEISTFGAAPDTTQIAALTPARNGQGQGQGQYECSDIHDYRT